MSMFVHRFTVKGTFAFPIDMLRYDSCMPDTEMDSNKIQESIKSYGTEKVEPIVLRKYTTTKSLEHQLTNARWKSFGWEITSIVDCRKIT